MIFKINDVDLILDEESNNNIEHIEWFFSVLSNSEWENDTFEIFDKCSDKEGIALDLGAWIGVTTIYMSKKFKKVISIEPDKNALTSFEKNLKKNTCDNFEIIEKVIFNDTKKNVYFGVNKFKNSKLGDSMSQSRTLPISDEDYLVQTITLKEITDKYKISFVKVDIEGGEENILEDLFFYGNLYKWKLWISFHFSWWDNKDTDRFLKILPLVDKIKLNNIEVEKLNFFDSLKENNFSSYFFEF